MKWWLFSELDSGAVASSRPIVTPTTEEWYAMLGALTNGDDQEWILLQMCASLGDMMYRVASPGFDVNGDDGWSTVFNLDVTPAEFIPYLGQYVGVRFDLLDISGLSPIQLRDLVRAKPGQARGRPATIAAVASQYLTGTRRIVLNERAGGDPYRLAVYSYSSETPDQARVLAALMSQKPAGIIMTYNVVDGVAWDDLVGTWNAQTLAWDEYAGVVP